MTRVVSSLTVWVIVCFLSTDGLGSVCRVFVVEGTSESGPILRLPESSLPRRHRAVSLLHEIRSQSLTASFTKAKPCSSHECVHVCGYLTACFPQLSQLVQRAVENNSLTIEPVAMSALPLVKASALECGGPKWVCVFVAIAVLSSVSLPGGQIIITVCGLGSFTDDFWSYSCKFSTLVNVERLDPWAH